MTIDAATVRQMARLAELAVAEHDVPLLAAQLEGIVRLVAQLDDLPAPNDREAFAVGPARLALRADVVAPIPMTRTPADMAPAIDRGFYVVPRLGGLAEE
ncbi:MAG TPA: Asp-tRNA(Asn)/Glu-tRNA(Gln) amidotransferase subunit GatC [Gemmatimonadales bacterium]|nr:Asp-tRNA(Asn)/Glu-tRNA(Gln) amidotransferase subunit GatC [Gemmatimonadales bacterium]